MGIRSILFRQSMDINFLFDTFSLKTNLKKLIYPLLLICIKNVTQVSYLILRSFDEFISKDIIEPHILVLLATTINYKLGCFELPFLVRHWNRTLVRDTSLTNAGYLQQGLTIVQSTKKYFQRIHLNLTALFFVRLFITPLQLYQFYFIKCLIL